MPTFTTIVTHIENLELRKDTGQLPYQFHKILGYDATIVSYFYTLQGGRDAGPQKKPDEGSPEIDLNYPYLKSETPGLKVHFLENLGRGKFYERAVLEYLKKESRNIDVLNLFHFNPQNIFYSLYYKLKNPKGKVYLKLDIDISYYKLSKEIFNIKGRTGQLKKIFYDNILIPYFFKKVSLITAESEAGRAYYAHRFPLSKGKLALIPNGLDSDRISKLAPHFKTFEEKEDIVLIVGRIGAVQKNHQLLLDAIPAIKGSNWKFYFAGPISPGFEKDISDFFIQHPAYKTRVFFLGNISDAAELYELYNSAKVFCMPSKWEGFPLAAVEAAYFGNALVLSDSIDAASTLMGQNGGTTFNSESVDSLAAALNRYLDNPELLKKSCEGIAAYARQLFTWESLVKKIDIRLQKA